MQCCFLSIYYIIILKSQRLLLEITKYWVKIKFLKIHKFLPQDTVLILRSISEILLREVKVQSCFYIVVHCRLFFFLVSHCKLSCVCARHNILWNVHEKHRKLKDLKMKHGALLQVLYLCVFLLPHM